MNNFTKSLSIYLLPVLGLLLYSCIDDPVNPDGNLVNGILCNGNGKKVTTQFEYFYISPGNYPISYLPENAEFVLDTYRSPYDLVITSFLSRISIKYHNITGSYIHPVYFDPDDYSYEPFRSIMARVVIPKSVFETTIYVKFISSEDFKQIQHIYTISKGDSDIYLELMIPRSNFFVSGKVMVVEAENWPNLSQINFKKFGLKTADSLYDFGTVRFFEDDLLYDPPEVITNFKNIVPQGYTGANNSAEIVFSGSNTSSNLMLSSDLYNNANISVPILPVDCQIKYTGRYYGASLYYLQHAFKYINIQPGQNCIVTHKEPITLLYPNDNDSNVNGLTEFIINDNEPGGVYLYDFVMQNSKNFRMYTTSKQLNFSDICARGFEFRPNGRYIWWVSKFPEFRNVDELLNTPYVTDPKYNSVQMSMPRYFYTGP